eukprot:TRINITY_DN10047_c0_g5_i1.p1 TRINITY_DN10047_c0_g5~~TRINITY_DN10047_c0_g5_i1.p1  ORF type:complete len:307 (-),score=16.88 TRINITY_DN10047_c0_g5_i1:49-969(-)
MTNASTKPPQLFYWALLVTSCASFVGSLLIMCSWLFPKCRSKTRKLVVILSVTDFFSSICYILGVVLIGYYEGKNTNDVHTVCRFLAPFNIFFTCSSFLWTACIAVHLYISVRRGTNSSYTTIYHIISWGYPLATLITVFATRSGDRADTQTYWCFIAAFSSKVKWLLLRSMTVYLPLVISWFIALVFYLLTRFRLNSEFKQQEIVALRVKSHFNLSTKLTFIPLVFIFLRVWGMVATIVQGVYGSDYDYSKFVWLEFLHCIGDPGQGFVNSLFYVVFSKKIRKSYVDKLFNRKSGKYSEDILVVQ